MFTDALPGHNEETEVTACVFTPSSQCAKAYPIRVKNCGNFNVYRLVKTTGCDEAYCYGEWHYMSVNYTFVNTVIE